MIQIILVTRFTRDQLSDKLYIIFLDRICHPENEHRRLYGHQWKKKKISICLPFFCFSLHILGITTVNLYMKLYSPRILTGWVLKNWTAHSYPLKVVFILAGSLQKQKHDKEIWSSVFILLQLCNGFKIWNLINTAVDTNERYVITDRNF